MKRKFLGFIPVLFILIMITLQAGCISTPEQNPAPSETTPAPLSDTPLPATNTPEPPEPPSPSATPRPPSATPTPTALPPTSTPLPPTPTYGPASASVCAQGCDFTSIQAALDHPETGAGAIIEIRDAVHTEADISVDKEVVIRGLGTKNTIVQAGESLEASPGRVFHIQRDVTITLSDMTIQHGKPSIEEQCGGGVLNFGALTVDKVVVTANTANGGAGICNSGELTVINSSIFANIAHEEASRGLECGSGGGIKSGGKSLTILNSSVYDNQTASGNLGRNRGGGIHIGCGCTATIINSTISNNKAGENGGGVYLAGELTLLHTTISGNHAKGRGGGILVLGALRMENSLIAGNRGQGGNCAIGKTKDASKTGAIELNRHNLVGDDTCDPEFSGDPQLGPLEDHGGETLTQALFSDSPAIDAIPVFHCSLTTDQRGAPRPVSMISDASPCDIGAFEAQNDE